MVEKINFDEKDRKLLSLLQQDARLSYRQLAKKAKMSVLTVMKRVKSMEEQKIITGYHASFNPELIGYDIHAIVKVRVAKGKLLDVERKIATDKHIYAVFDHTGHFDTTLLCRFKHTRDLDRFLKRIQKYDFVERTETLIILNTIKEGELKV